VPVLLAALGVLLVSLDASVNIAFPSMGAAFGAGPATIRWVIVCYVLTYAITSFLAGLLADRVGPGPVFAAGVWLSAACFLTILAVPSLGPFLAVRVAQGVAAGLVYGTAPALVTLALPRERHGRGLGLMTLGMGAGLAIGPLVGGVLVEAFGWRSVFVYRAPLAVGLGLLARPGPASPRAAVPALSLEGLAEIGRPAVLGTLAQTFLANGAQFAVWLLVPFYLVDVRGLSPSAGGALFMLMPLGTAAAAPLAGLATDRLGPAWPLVSGLVLEGLGLLGISRLSSESAVPLVGLALGMVGLGLGIFQVPNLAQTMRSFPVSRQGAAGGLAFTSRTLGVVNGVEMAAALFGSPGAGAPFLDGFARALLGAAAVCGLAAGLAALASAAPRRRAA
jgi:MFS family permease